MQGWVTSCPNPKGLDTETLAMYLAILLGRKRRETNNFITCLSFCNQNTLILPGLPSKLELLCEKGFELGAVLSGMTGTGMHVVKLIANP